MEKTELERIFDLKKGNTDKEVIDILITMSLRNSRDVDDMKLRIKELEEMKEIIKNIFK